MLKGLNNGQSGSHQDCFDSGEDAEAHQRLAYFFLENTYSWWYGVRAEWEPRPQQMFEDMKNRDPEFYSHLERVFADNATNRERFAAFKDLHDYFFASKEYQELVK